MRKHGPVVYNFFSKFSDLTFYEIRILHVLILSGLKNHLFKKYFSLYKKSFALSKKRVFSIFIYFYINRKKYCFREKFPLPFFDGFTYFGMF